MNNSSFYIVTAITDLDPSNPQQPLGSTRCLGWFPTFQEAHKAIMYSNDGMFSGLTGLLSNHLQLNSFRWIVVEQTTVGLFAQVLSRVCYCWIESSGHYEVVLEPECLASYPALGLA